MFSQLSSDSIKSSSQWCGYCRRQQKTTRL